TDGRRGVLRFLDVVRRQVDAVLLGLVGELGPDPGVAVRLQLQGHRVGGGRTRGPGCTPARTDPSRRTGPAVAAGTRGRSRCAGPPGSRRAPWRRSPARTPSAWRW